MPHKLFRIQRADPGAPARPVMLAIAGDSAAGKTTITRGLVEALGADRCTAVCVDDYHRYDRAERSGLPFTVLHPACNYVQVMEQHLQLLAMGQPVLKPVYDHRTGQFTRPVLVEPRQFVIVEGLLPLHTELARACFDATVYLDPPEAIRREWKIRRDTAERGYTAEAVRAELERRAGVGGVHPAAARVRRHRDPVRPAAGPGRARGHAVVSRAAAPPHDQAPGPGRRGTGRRGRRPGDDHPPQARPRRGQPPGRRAARARGRGP